MEPRRLLRREFASPGYETNLLYLAALTTLVIGGSGPLAADGLLGRNNRARWEGRVNCYCERRDRIGLPLNT